MSWLDIVPVVVLLAIVFLLTKPMGLYMAHVFGGEHTFADPVLKPVERFLYRLIGVDEAHEMKWTEYAFSVLGLSAVGFLLLYAQLRLQGYLPLNPRHIVGMSPALAFNTSVSFLANTDWQNYAGEVAVSNLTQMAGLAVQNFISPAVGLAVAIALVRGVSRQQTKEIGNFWVDITRSILFILLPLSIVGAFFLASQGVVQTLAASTTVQTVEHGLQTIPLGPEASQGSIRMVGQNGEGFFNANSAHPFENPNPLTNFLEILAVFLIPAGLTYTYGYFVRGQQHGWVIWVTMLLMFVVSIGLMYGFERAGNPNLARAGASTSVTATQDGGNQEGKEVRFGTMGSVLFNGTMTDTAGGATNSQWDSYTPMAGCIAALNIMLGELIFGAFGAGLYHMLIFVVLAVFIAGLMVGRTPEYLGKKIQAREMKLAMIGWLAMNAGILVMSAIAVALPAGRSSVLNPGPHGLTEILYSFTSQIGNNGTAFAGLNTTTVFYNTLGGFTILIGRFLMILPVLAVAGSFAEKTPVAPSAGTFPTTGPLFIVLLISTILIVAGLTFFPVLALGPIVEHLLMQVGRLF